MTTAFESEQLMSRTTTTPAIRPLVAFLPDRGMRLGSRNRQSRAIHVADAVKRASAVQESCMRWACRNAHVKPLDLCH